MREKGTKRGGFLFYGWYIIIASFFILFFTSGARYSIGVMFKPMISEFGWDRGSISLAFFVHMAVFAISVPFVGRFYDRYGPKWVIIISTCFVAAGYGLTATTHHLWQLILYYGVLAAAGLGGTSVPMLSALTSKWFEKRQGLAVSLALTGNSLGQFALVPVFTTFTIRYGWRLSYLYIGLIILIVNIILTLFVIKGDPHHLALKPYGYKDRDDNGKQKDGGTSKSGKDVRFENSDFNLRQAMGTYSFWLFLIAMFICGSGDFFVTTHLIPFATDYGVSPVTAGNMLAWYGFMSLLGILVAGPVSDVIGNRLPIAITFLMRAILFLIIYRYKNIHAFYLFALAFGFTHLITAPLTPILVGRLFGFSHIGVISGVINTVHHLAGGFWAYVGGIIFDITGQYDIAFIISAGMALIAFVCSLLVLEKRHNRNTKDCVT